MFKLFGTAIVVSYTLVSWHQENVQIRRHLKEKNVFRLYPTFVQDNSYIADDAVYTLTDQVLCPILGSQRESTNKDAYN